MTQVVVPRPAATVVIVRDSADGPEILLFQRSPKAKFMPGAYVFPGGAIDAEDYSPGLAARCSGVTEAGANRRLGVESGGLSYYVACIRECFEECGLVLGGEDGTPVELLDDAIRSRYDAHRDALNKGTLSFEAICQAENLRLAADRLTYFAHWITPKGAPRRYDTRFFMAIAPERQDARHDGHELVDQVWVRPETALAQDDAGELSLRTPTRTTINSFLGASSTADLIERMQSQREIPTILPVLTENGGRLLPGDPGYEEQGRIDPPAGAWR